MSEFSAMHLPIFSVINSQYATSSEYGEQVYQWVDLALTKNSMVTISFINIQMVTAAFLNAAIGQLYGKFSEEHIRSFLKVEGLDKEDLDLLKTVVDNAKLYFKKQKEYKNEQ